MEALGSKSAGEAGTPPRRSGGGDGKAAVVLPGYLRQAAGSCHHVCKYGGTHAFEEKEARGGGGGRGVQPRSSRRRQQPPAELESQRTAALAKVRSASSRRRAEDFSKPEVTTKPSKAAAVDGVKLRRNKVAVADTDAVEWKDIVAYDAVPAACGSSPRPARIVAGDSKKKDVIKGKKPCDNSKVVTQQADVGAVKPDGLGKKKVVKSVASKLTGKTSAQPDRSSGVGSAGPPSEKKKLIKSTESVKPPKEKKDIAVERKAIGQEMIHGDAATAVDDYDVKGGKSLYPLDEEDQYATAAAVAESAKPIAAAHRRVKSMSISSRSVQFPFTRQASKSSVTFRLRSKSGRAAPPKEEEKTAVPRLRLFRRGDAGSSSGNGVQLRIRSLRRRGGGVGGGGTAGFIVPSVALRHQKTLEKKKSRKLYNSVIEETASKLVKVRKSKVKALVGAFESIISKIGK